MRVKGIVDFNQVYAGGEGAYLWRTGGDQYLDLLAGQSVFSLGQGRPITKQAIRESERVGLRSVPVGPIPHHGPSQRLTGRGLGEAKLPHRFRRSEPLIAV